MFCITVVQHILVLKWPMELDGTIRVPIRGDL
jgi:hypothetical protein